MTSTSPTLDPKVKALLTRELGTNQSITKICMELGQVFTAFLPDLVSMDTQLRMNFYFERCEVGYKNDLIADLDDYMVLSDGSLKNWCPDFTIACSSGIIMSMVECLMGGDPAMLQEPEARPASAIELQMSPLIMDKIASVIKSAVDAPGNFEPMMSKPYNAANRPKPADDYVDTFAALVRIKIEFGATVSHFAVIVPQRHLLRTTIKPPVAISTPKNSIDWSEILKDQVEKSDVKVEARIHLTPLTLGVISRLRAGDVIPFVDKGDVRVQVSANGRDLYACEFGRAGEHYTVRVKETAGSDEDLLRTILG